MHSVMWLFFWIGFVATVFQDLITIVSGEWYYVIEILYNYPPKGRWIVVDIYLDAKHQGIYLMLWTDPEGDFFTCFSIFQISWEK